MFRLFLIIFALLFVSGIAVAQEEKYVIPDNIKERIEKRILKDVELYRGLYEINNSGKQIVLDSFRAKYDHNTHALRVLKELADKGDLFALASYELRGAFIFKGNPYSEDRKTLVQEAAAKGEPVAMTEYSYKDKAEQENYLYLAIQKYDYYHAYQRLLNGYPSREDYCEIAHKAYKKFGFELFANNRNLMVNTQTKCQTFSTLTYGNLNDNATFYAFLSDLGSEDALFAKASHLSRTTNSPEAKEIFEKLEKSRTPKIAAAAQYCLARLYFAEGAKEQAVIYAMKAYENGYISAYHQYRRLLGYDNIELPLSEGTILLDYNGNSNICYAGTLRTGI